MEVKVERSRLLIRQHKAQTQNVLHEEYIPDSILLNNELALLLTVPGQRKTLKVIILLFRLCVCEAFTMIFAIKSAADFIHAFTQKRARIGYTNIY